MFIGPAAKASRDILHSSERRMVEIGGIGANVYYYQQITGDSGTGAKLERLQGALFRCRAGLVLHQAHQEGADRGRSQKWLPELSVENRLKEIPSSTGVRILSGRSRVQTPGTPWPEQHPQLG